MLRCPGWGLITAGWDVVCGGGPSSPSHKQRQELLSPCEWCGVRRGEQVLCLIPASQSKSVNTIYTECSCLNSQSTDTTSPCFFFFLVLISPVISHSSALMFYSWRLKDLSCHLHPLRPNFFLCATQERPATPPGLFISSHLRVPLGNGVIPPFPGTGGLGLAGGQEVMYSLLGMLQVGLLDISLSWDSFCRLASLSACSQCTLALAPSLLEASR